MNEIDVIIGQAKRVGDCLVWQGYFGKDGRGRIRFRGRPGKLAYRVLYELVIGPVPEGLELDHLCRNPACIAPEHLEPVTHAENMRRRQSDFCKNGHPFDTENTYRRNGRRYCRLCNRVAVSRYQKRRRGA